MNCKQSNWSAHFTRISSTPQAASASFGSDFAALDLSGRSDFRAPFEEPDPRVHLLPPAAVPTRPDYDVFGVENPPESSKLSLIAVLAGIASMILGSYSVGFQHGLHKRGR
jgi:hypothetical protein